MASQWCIAACLVIGVSAVSHAAETKDGKSPTAIVKEATSPANSVRNADGSRAPEGGPAKPTESWTSGCNPDKGDVGNRQQGCERSDKAKTKE
jgi:hypothetical protein